MDEMANNNFLFLLKEYEKLKDEQNKRIAFRDNILYLTLTAIGAIFSFSFDKPHLNIALLLLPFLCVALGWTYLTNDEKISAIGNYVRLSLVPKLTVYSSEDKLSLSNHWEQFRKQDKLRHQRKWFQLLIDLCVYCISGFISICTFYRLHDSLTWWYIVLSISEGILLIFLASQFIRYANLDRKE